MREHRIYIFLILATWGLGVRLAEEAAFMFWRNPQAHSVDQLSKGEAMEALGLASTLARIIDDAVVVEVNEHTSG